MSRTDDERIDDEITKTGGYAKFLKASWNEEDVDLWRSQALYLSHLRESGNQEQAALAAGYELSAVKEWEEADILGFEARARAARKEVAAKLEDSLVSKLLSGEIKSAAAYKLILTALDADRYGDNKADRNSEALQLTKEIREFAAKWREMQEQYQNEEESTVEIIPADITVSDLLKLRAPEGE